MLACISVGHNTSQAVSNGSAVILNLHEDLYTIQAVSKSSAVFLYLLEDLYTAQAVSNNSVVSSNLLDDLNTTQAVSNNSAEILNLVKDLPNFFTEFILLKLWFRSLRAMLLAGSFFYHVNALIWMATYID